MGVIDKIIYEAAKIGELPVDAAKVIILVETKCKTNKKIKVPDKMPNTSNGVGTPNSELEAYPLAKVILIYETECKLRVFSQKKCSSKNRRT